MGTSIVEMFEYEVCPLCGGQDASEHGVADVSGHPCYHPDLSPAAIWLTCDGCGHSFRRGFYTPEAFALVLRSSPEHLEVGYDIEAQRPISARLVERVVPFVSSGRWLDVGFGNASLLFTAAEFGFEPVGCDLRAAGVEMLRFFGIEAHCADIADLDCAALGSTAGPDVLDEQVSVVSMNDVVEHIPYPAVALRAAHRLLVDDGVLLVSMPNIESTLWKVLDIAGVNPYWSEIEHYHNFGRTTLYRLLRDCGFEPVSYGVSERYRCGMEVVARKLRL